MKHGLNTDENSDGTISHMIELLKHQEEVRREEKYQKWCNRFASLPEDARRKLKDGLLADVELQPYRWIQHGLDLIGSRKAFGTVQLSDNQQGRDFKSYLPYPVFQMGAEVFLKGMWLYKNSECRILDSDSYVAPDRRKYFLGELKKLSRNHDLLEIIKHIEDIDTYKQDAFLSRFLKIVSGISKEFYLPISDGEKRWADERYPKRFYKDSLKYGAADAFKSYPEHWPISRLFSEAAKKIEAVWEEESAH